MKKYTFDDILEMEKIRRLNLINSIPGFKSANLIGTSDKDSNLNLAIFSSVIHLGSNPPLLGFVLRPTTVKRHTYDNIKKTGYFTVNHVNESIISQAHQTSAKYSVDVSEFDKTGLNSEEWKGYPAPYVRESLIKIGMEFIEENEIKVNGTKLIIGKILEIHFPDNIQQKDGSIDLSAAGTVAISGLDTYHEARKITKLAYARP